LDFSRSATIGRQERHFSASALRDTLHQSGEIELAQQLGNLDSPYAEQVFEWLGAQTLDSFDASDYECPTHVHDMNTPIAAAHHNKFSVLVDGGSLEHVFNFPEAILNCMKMVEPGGHFVGISPANNFFGHGFYQFSPELYFSVLTEQNGFETLHVIAFEDRADAPWYRARKPGDIGRRVILENSRSVFLGVIARKIRHVQSFRKWPLQSDYVSRWNSESAASPAPAPISRAPFAVRVERRLRRAFRMPLGFMPEFFDRIEWSR
jgi:hypothetical protein